MTDSSTSDGSSGQKPVFMQLAGVFKSFGNKKVLDGIDFMIEKGSFTCICGPSGCGKSTIINIMAGYMPPDAGSCIFEGKPVTGPDVERLVVFQESGLFPWMSLWDNVLFGPRNQGQKLTDAIVRGKKLLEVSGLTGFAAKYPGQLSGGMQRRGELVRALINDPKVLLLDEPFRGLDAMTRQIMQAHFVNVFEKTGTTMVLITSELDEAIYMGDTIYLLSAMPTAVKKRVDVTLPRPRELKQLATPEFEKLLVEVYDSMEAEAMKSFHFKTEADGKAKVFKEEL